MPPFDENPQPGLDIEPRDRWPAVGRGSAIDRLAPETELHKYVLRYLLKRLDFSEEKMTRFYDRWRTNEKKIQAYVSLPEYEAALKKETNKGAPAAFTPITVPYAYATISSTVTYGAGVFVGRKPTFQVEGTNASSVKPASNMELVLQYNVEHMRFVSTVFRFLTDIELYGLGAVKIAWKEETAYRTVRKPLDEMQAMALGLPGAGVARLREQRKVYQGNIVDNIDPFRFFPDPTVPMSELNRRGEYVFWRDFVGKHQLLKDEADGIFKYVNRIPGRKSNDLLNDTVSARQLMAGGIEPMGGELWGSYGSAEQYQLDQGSVEIIPKELGLGDSTVPEKWLFTIANRAQIIQAEPLGLDHDRHPVAVAEPYSLGYSFGSLSLCDYLGPIQDTVSFLINSRMFNVRTGLNNILVYDPALVERQDIENPKPGKLIRLKAAAIGKNPRDAVHQIPVQDVTANHFSDLQNFIRIGDSIAAITDNLRGQPQAGGRKTATEIRTAGEAGSMRLATHFRLISSQAMIDLAQQMSLNIQQGMDIEFYTQIVGPEGAMTPFLIQPEHLVGDFKFPIHDGTLPLDRVAMLDVWKELFVAIAQDQELRASYSLPKIFEFIADLGGAKNLSNFRVATAPNDGQLEQDVQSGNAVPLREAKQSGLINNIPPNPGQRLAGSLQ